MEGCSHCSHVLTHLEKLKSEFPGMNVKTLDITSDEGQKIVAQNGIMSSPGVLIDGSLAFFGPKNQEEIRTVILSSVEGLSKHST